MAVLQELEHGIGKSCKDYMVKELSKKFQSDKNMFITGFWGLGSEDLNKLRSSLLEHSSRYLVVKNSIAKKALKDSKLDELTKFIEGGVGIVFGGKDPINTAKVLSKFAKSHNQLVIRSGILEGEIIDKNKIKEISSLPSKQELLTKLVWLVNSPISGFVNVLAGTLRSFVYAIKAYKEKLEKKGG